MRTARSVVTFCLFSNPVGNGEILEFSKDYICLQVVPASAIPDGWMGLDIGPDSIKTFSEALVTTQTIIWNGPMGVFEFEKFAAGTEVLNKLYFC